ncbi:GNAT family N-acetyltransferase [Chitinimonas sp. BJB300]|uniref:GNAT family N-acetyltransferase n=1 Tax=Chitinimonas sp. BJB300 TaxID=1559339 RepID=UPI000C0D0605|nr:GNAT family N-acetyltransferase [Chitinimonas sp. BJB300]PHV12396.1 hypothetical protein CSQ89_05770 [Chitinimonas sp. BJB300]TSJ88992.1 GNAT family N-acetyltransferase [Chitinimonas sp. BJB300]
MSCADLLLKQLSLSNLPEIHDHLMRLDDASRSQRFAQRASNEVVAGYTYKLDFVRDMHYGVWEDASEAQQLRAYAHLAMNVGSRIGEIGISVEEPYRRHGVARQLMARAVMHARNRGLLEIMMYFQAYNSDLLALARCLKMQVSVSNGEGMARLRLNPPSPGSYADEVIAGWAEVGPASWVTQTSETGGVTRLVWDVALQRYFTA